MKNYEKEYFLIRDHNKKLCDELDALKLENQKMKDIIDELNLEILEIYEIYELRMEEDL